MKVDKLTIEQEVKLIEYRNKWLNIGRSTKPLDREVTSESVKWLYEYKDLKAPYMWFCDSPIQAQILINILKSDKLLGNNLKVNLWENLWENFRSNLSNNLKVNLWHNLWDNIRYNLCDNLRSNLRGNLEDNIFHNLRTNIWDNLGESLCVNLKSGLSVNLEDNILHNLWGNLWDNIRVNLRGNLEDNIRVNLVDNLRSNLWENLGNNLWENLWDNIRVNLSNNLKVNLRDNSLNFEHFFAPNLESHWVGFYDFILHEIFPERVGEFEAFSNQCKKFYENTYLIIPFEGICFISERPTSIALDDQGRLHNPKGPVMTFKDSYEFHALSGIRVDKDMLSFNPKQIMAVRNSEQRLVLIRNYGVENMLDELEAKSLDRFKDYELFEVPIEGNKEKLLKMQNPSEPKQHYEWVEPHIKTCQEAMAWRCGFDLYTNPKMEA